MPKRPTLTDRKCLECGSIILRAPPDYVPERMFTSIDGGGETRIVSSREYCPKCPSKVY